MSYIWANKLALEQTLDNAHTDRVKMIAVRSGGERAGRWMSEERNILADYKGLYTARSRRSWPALAIMTDTDNTGEKGLRLVRRHFPASPGVK